MADDVDDSLTPTTQANVQRSLSPVHGVGVGLALPALRHSPPLIGISPWALAGETRGSAGGRGCRQESGLRTAVRYLDSYCHHVLSNFC